MANSIVASSWSTVRDAQYRVEPVWTMVGFVVFIVPSTLAVVASALAVAAALKIDGVAVRRWVHRTGNGILR